MSLPTEVGKHIARPLQWGMKPAATGTPELSIRFDVSAKVESDGSETPTVQGCEIVGRFYPIETAAKGGGLNKRTVETLRNSLGWTGTTWESLVNGAWGEVEVQLVLEFKEYQGKKYINVKYMNPRDYQDGEIENDPSFVKSLDAKYGSALRAMTPPAAAPPNTKLLQNQIAKKAAWEAYRRANPGIGGTQLGDMWKASLSTYFNNKPDGMISADEWTAFEASGFNKSVEQDFDPPTHANDDIPF